MDQRQDYKDSRRKELRARLQQVIANAVKALKGDAGVIAIWDKDTGRFNYETTIGLSLETLESHRQLLDGQIPALREGLGDGSGGGYASGDPTAVEAPLRHIVALPLKANNGTLGLIYIFRSTSEFVSEDRALLGAFAEQVAMAVENLRLAKDLLEEESRLESIIEHSADGIVGLDSQRRITSFNSAMERLTGWHRQEARGQLCQDLLHPMDNNGNSICQTSCPLLLSQGAQESVYEFEATIRTKDGQPVDVVMTYVLVYSEGGRVSQAVVTFRDISRVKQVEAMRTTFLSMVSHELQTPVSIIKAYAEVLRRKLAEKGGEIAQEALAAIDEESDRLSTMIGNLLYAAKIEAGAVTLERGPVAIPALAEKAVRRMEVRNEVHTFHTKVSPDLPAALGDEEKIEEVLFNLLDNAIKYSPQGGAITIDAQATGEEVIVSVSDQGPGIPIREIENMFQRFHRIDLGLARQPHGTGLGLFICQAIVRAHGGRIWVESERGKGSRFYFTLPRYEKPHLPALVSARRLSLEAPKEEGNGSTTEYPHSG